MDKYEYRVKTEQMLGYVEKKQYKKAMEIADTIDWRRVKSASMLSSVSEIYEYNGEYQKSREILLVAFDRSPGSRKIIYRLGTLALKLNEIEEASDCYEEFVKLAPRDPNQYILRYKILKAQEAPLTEQITALEDFKKAEYIEKWAYELAKLYHEAGMTTECLEECDDLILWFSEGKYVYQAMELKMKYKPLTPLQQKKYDNRPGAPKKEVVEEPKPEPVAQKIPVQSVAKEPTVMPNLRQVISEVEKDSVEEPEDDIIITKPEEPERHSAITNIITGSSLQEALKTGVAIASGINIEEKAMKEKDEELRVNGQMKIDEILQEWEEKQKEHAEEIEKQKEKDKERLQKEREEAERRMEAERLEVERKAAEAEAARKAAEEEAARKAAEEEAARKAAEEEAARKAAEEEAARKAAEEEAARKAAEEEETTDNLAQMMDQMEIVDDEDTEEVSVDDITIDEALIKDVISESEVDEDEFEEVEEADEDEFEEDEFEEVEEADEDEFDEDEFEEVEEADEDEFDENEFEEVEEADEDEFDEDEFEEVEEADEDEFDENEFEEVEEADEDEFDEDEFEEVEEADEDEFDEDEFEEVEEADEDEFDEDEFEEVEEADEDEFDEDGFEEFEETDSEIEESKGFKEFEDDLDDFGDFGDFEDEDDLGEDEFDEESFDEDEFDEDEFDEDEFDEDEFDEDEFDEDEFDEDEFDEDEFDEDEFDEDEFDEDEFEEEDLLKNRPTKRISAQSLEIEEPSEEEIQERIKKSKGSGVPFDTGFVVTGRYDLSATSEIGLKAGLTEDQKKLFSYFVPVRGMSEQIVSVLDNDRRAQREGTSKTGNLLVIGRKGSGKTVLAVDIVKAIQKQRNLKQGKVAIVTGESLNKKELTNIMQKLRGGAIIIEKAGKLNSRTIKELNYLMEKKTGELLFVLEDQRKPLERIMTANPDFKKKFTSKLELPVFINDELVTFGQTYAKENGYKLDEMGILALYSRIDMMQREDHSVSVAEVKEIMDEAIEHSQKATAKHLARRVFGKGTDESDRVILKEEDFKI